MNYPITIVPSYLVVQTKHNNDAALQCKMLFTKYSKHRIKRVPQKNPQTLKCKINKEKEWPSRNAGAHFDMHTTRKIKVLMKWSEKASISNNRVFTQKTPMFQLKHFYLSSYITLFTMIYTVLSMYAGKGLTSVGYLLQWLALTPCLSVKFKLIIIIKELILLNAMENLVLCSRTK